jgi:hypothetical protein
MFGTWLKGLIMVVLVSVYIFVLFKYEKELFCINAMICIINSDLICFDHFCPNQGQPYSSYGGIIIGQKKPKTKLLYKQINMKKNNSIRPQKTKNNQKQYDVMPMVVAPPGIPFVFTLPIKEKYSFNYCPSPQISFWIKPYSLGKPSKLISRYYLGMFPKGGRGSSEVSEISLGNFRQGESEKI